MSTVLRTEEPRAYRVPSHALYTARAQYMTYGVHDDYINMMII